MTQHPRDVLDRPAPPPDATLRYGDLPEHVLDLRWPTMDVGRPASLVVVIHGGFWRSEYDRHHTGPQCAGLADAGYAVAALEYRRTGMPGGGWPGTLDDVAAGLGAVRDLVTEAASAVGRPVDLDRTVLLGHSAGGQLAAWAATRPPGGVVGAVSLAGVLDLGLAAELGLDPGPGGPAVQALLGGRPDDVPERYAAADPARLGAPPVPVTALHGDADDVVPLQLSRSYCERTGQRLVVLPGVEHFGVIDPLSPAWPEVLKHLGAAADATAR